VNIAVELGGRDESAAGVVHGMFGRLGDAVRQAIEEGRRSGELDAGRDPAATAASVLATVSGLGVLARLDVRPDRVDAVIRTTVATL
jgi:TetR/AcrR family transcriptional regulator, transcriptional repressor for nem operon